MINFIIGLVEAIGTETKYRIIIDDNELVLTLFNENQKGSMGFPQSEIEAMKYPKEYAREVVRRLKVNLCL